MKTRDSFIKIRDKLKKYNKEYYNSNPSIDDSEYDDLKKKYDHLLLKNPELKKYDDGILVRQHPYGRTCTAGHCMAQSRDFFESKTFALSQRAIRDRWLLLNIRILNLVDL